MRILFAGHSLADPMGGGELSARVLLGRLAPRHEVEAVCAASTRRDYLSEQGVRCRDHAVRWLTAPAGVPHHLAAMFVETQFRPVLVGHLQDSAPDLLILQQPGYLRPTDVPTTTKVIVFMRSLACYGAGEANPSRWRQLAGRPFRVARFRRGRHLLDHADLVVSNSRFLQNALLTRVGLSTHVITPFIDTDRARLPVTGRDRDCVTFVGLDEWKGASIALRLAESLPDRRFLFLTGSRASAKMRTRAGRLTNVTCLDWTEDMGAVFERTRILLVPSLWEEPFGRLPVEAGACGIPTLASARGGLPESVGAGGVLIDPVDDLPQWIRRIRELDDPGLYASLSEAAQAHAATLSVEVTWQRFQHLVRREVAVQL